MTPSVQIRIELSREPSDSRFKTNFPSITQCVVFGRELSWDRPYELKKITSVFTILYRMKLPPLLFIVVRAMSLDDDK